MFINRIRERKKDIFPSAQGQVYLIVIRLNICVCVCVCVFVYLCVGGWQVI